MFIVYRAAPFVALGAFVALPERFSPGDDDRRQAMKSPGVSDLTALALRSSVAIEMLAMANGVIKPLDIRSPPFNG
ncbi:MAG TPA: hypothetical protein PKA57_04925 [Parvibaculum sp.]|uniref:hypothetical protein n=1 Tax=Parvibaculum sp. TaxID=2024848 RepID=UPI002CDE4BF8|nr:hypothetical protein [Parvibaculum sp.]HMM13949.1 hypothetical protein [Parvibaculum sp.]